MHDVSKQWLKRKYLGNRAPYHESMGETILPVLVSSGMTLPKLRQRCRELPLVKVRDEAIARLMDAGFRNCEVAKFLNQDQSTVSIAFKRYRKNKENTCSTIQ